MKNQKVENQVEVKQATPLAVVEPQATTQEVLSSDIIIPKLLLMQGLSDFVTERKAGLGDVVRSTTVEKLGNPETAIDFIPLKATMGWIEQEKVGQKFEYRKAVARTAQNENYPWSFWRNANGAEFDRPGQMGATEWRRVKTIDVFALLPSDIDAFEKEMAKAKSTGEMPDLTKTILPVVISFRSTSFNAGKTVATFFAQVAEMATHAPQVRSYAYTLPLGCVAEKNDKGSFYIFKVGQPKKLDAKYLPYAERWVNTLNSVKDIRVDTTGDSERAPEGGAF